MLKAFRIADMGRDSTERYVRQDLLALQSRPPPIS